MGEIRKMDSSDLSSVVDVHLSSFNGFFLSSMGARFLNKFYQSILLDKTHIAFIYLTGEKVTGFVVGTAQPTGFYRRTLKKNLLDFIIAAIPVILKEPIMAVRLLTRLATARETMFEDNQALLMSIAVDPNEQGKGIGNDLVSIFLERARSLGCSCVTLTTDATNNDSVNHFYIKMGFHLSHEFQTVEGRRMNKYVYKLSGSTFQK